jgi:ribonucleoside-diphosphate reductase alpha chain
MTLVRDAFRATAKHLIFILLQHLLTGVFSHGGSTHGGCGSEAGFGADIGCAQGGAGRKPAAARAAVPRGLTVTRVFSRAGVSPFDQVEWERRKASITDDKGKTIFEQANVEVPKFWSMLATNVVASKYFYGDVTKSEREFSVRQIIHRVARTIADWGLRDGYFATPEDAETFYDELSFLCVNQYGAFNSPVWFNCGLYHQYGVGKAERRRHFYFDKQATRGEAAPSQYEYPQCSACFIQHVDDTMEDIMELARSEAMLFKFGSGSGTDLSTLRSEREKLSRRRAAQRPALVPAGLRCGRERGEVGRQDAPRGEDEHAQDLASGHQGVHRVQGERREEGLGADRAGLRRQLQRRGLRLGDASRTRTSRVRVTDDFMRAVIDDREWTTRWVTDPAKIPGPDLQGARTDEVDGRRHLDLRRSGRAVRGHDPTSGTPARTPAASTPATRAASTCSSTTRPATWPRST